MQGGAEAQVGPLEEYHAPHVGYSQAEKADVYGFGEPLFDEDDDVNDVGDDSENIDQSTDDAVLNDDDDIKCVIVNEFCEAAPVL